MKYVENKPRHGGERDIALNSIILDKNGRPIVGQ